MSIASDIAEWLEDEGVGTVGVNIFVGQLPDEPGPLISLSQYAGRPPPKDWDGEYPGLQIWGRGPTMESGYALMFAAFEKLHKAHELSLGTPSVRYLYIEANQSIAPMGKDSHGNWEWVQNFIVTKEM
jgi:hypothetical protein